MTSQSLDGAADGVRQDEIDLLVEGEMTSNQRSELIARMVSDDWRRCALAFMERDALRGSLAAIRRLRNSEPDCIVATQVLDAELRHGATNSTARISLRRNIWIALFATAATALIAIGAGLGLWLRPESFDRAAISGGNRPDNATEGTSLNATQNPEMWLQVSNVVNRLNVADGEVIAVVGVPRKHAQTEFLPVIQSELLGQQILDLPKPDVPREYRERAERTGWKFDVSRQFLSLNLPDGGSQLLPLDIIHYRYVGLETF